MASGGPGRQRKGELAMQPLRDINLPLRHRTVGRILADKARSNGERIFLKFEGRQFSYAQVDEISNRIANGLVAQGIARGEHIALLMDNRPEMLWLYFALGKVGAVAVPLNTAAKGELLTYYLTQSASTAIILDWHHAEKLSGVLPAVPAIVRAFVLDAPADGVDSPDGGGAAPGVKAGSLPPSLRVSRYEDLECAPATPVARDIAIGDPFLLLYTSGTTGPSKAVVVPHAFAITYGLQRARHFGYQPEDVLYTCLPLFHGNALHGACFSALAADATLALSRRFSARNFWREVREHGATQFNLLGAMANILWAQPETPADREHTVRQCTMVPVPEFGLAFEKRFNLKLTSIYALSDYGMGAILGPGHPPDKLRSAGLPPDEVSVAILDDEDFELPHGTAGEICLRPNQPWISSLGYFNMPEKSFATVRNQWFHTGDRGYVDADGYLYFVDRKKDAIRRRGENISSWEVEQIISRHPAVAEVAAFPVRAELAEDEVMAAVVLNPGASLNEAQLIDFCDRNMAHFMVPRFVEFMAALPKTMTEKVEKFTLVSRAQERLASIWDRDKAGIVLRR
jgi:crotonobetaine/carnitine-CoA ligase